MKYKYKYSLGRCRDFDNAIQAQLFGKVSDSCQL